MVKILNTGFQKGMPVLRTEGKGVFEVKSYDTFGPKIVATRQNYDDQALESRFLIEDMGRAKLREDIPIRLDDGFQEEALVLRNKLLMWRLRNYDRKLQFNDERIDGLQPRLQQIITPLLAILPGEDIRTTLINHAHRYNSELIADRALSWESEAILAILRLHDRSGVDGSTVQDIAREMNDQSEVGEALVPRKVGWILRAKLHLKPERTVKGFVVSFQKNKERIEVWRERLGITDADIKGEQEFDPNDIPF